MCRRFASSSRSWNLLLLVGAVAALATSLPAWSEDDPATAALAAALAADGGAGVQAAVVFDGEVVWNAALGHADLEADVAMTSDTRLRIGSVSKLVTAVLAARLAAAGDLDVDEPIQRWVADFPRHGGDERGGWITVRRLASHTSGIRHYDFSNVSEANNQTIYESLHDALAVFSGDPLVAAPGSQFHYTSFGFNLLGVAAAQAAELPFLEAVRVHVTEPLELGDTLGDESLALVPRRGRFYTVKPATSAAGRELINTIWRDSSDYYPSGGMLSTADDLARLAWEAFEGEALAGMPRRLFTTRATLDAGAGADRAAGTPIDTTFGWQVKIGEAGDVLWYGHGGLTNGATAEVRYDPNRRLAVAVVANYNFWFDDTPSVIRTALEEVPVLIP